MGILDKHAAILADAKETGLNPVPVEETKPKLPIPAKKSGFTFAEMVENATKAKPMPTETIFERNVPSRNCKYKLAVVFVNDDMLELEFSSWGTMLHYLTSLPDGCEVETGVFHQRGKS